MQPYHVAIFWVQIWPKFWQIWVKFRQIWIKFRQNLGEIKILHPQKHSISYGYAVTHGERERGLGPYHKFVFTGYSSLMKTPSLSLLPHIKINIHQSFFAFAL